MKAHADKEDPTAKAERLAEQARADAQYTTSTQALLGDQMQDSIRRYGARTAMAGVGGGDPMPNAPTSPYGGLPFDFRKAFSLITGQRSGG